jgi:hypothetical protein
MLPGTLPDHFYVLKDIALVQHSSFDSDLVSYNEVPTPIFINYECNFISHSSLDVERFQRLVIAENLNWLVQIGKQLTKKYRGMGLLLCRQVATPRDTPFAIAFLTIKL